MEVIDDLRDFVTAVDQLGELKHIEGADWNHEVGAITELMAERRGPALLFDRIKGYPEGYRILSNPFATLKRTGLVLGVPTEWKPVEMLDAFRHKIRNPQPIPPKEVKDGPVRENVYRGADVDLFRLPAPIWHEQDEKTRMIATGSAVITKDPDEGWVNLGAHRCQIVSKNSMSISLAKGHHARIMMEKYHKRGQSFPIAVSCGQDPVLLLVAGLSTDWGASEYDLAGWIKGRPVEVITSDVTGLPIPASSEIVIEGEIPPPDQTKWTKNGPFAEWAGIYSSIPAPIIEVKSIMHRDKPIILGTPPLEPPRPWYFSVPVNAALVWNALEAVGTPGVKGVWFGVEAWGPAILIVAIEQSYAGQAKQAALAAAGCRAGCYGSKYVIVVDSDIDITDMAQVVWAMYARGDVDNIDIVRGLWTSPADHIAIYGEKLDKMLFSGPKIIIDACWPYARMEEFPAPGQFSSIYRKKITEKWAEIFVS